jgi:hypothetical protein
MIKQKLIAVFLLAVSSTSFAQSNNSSVCSWGVLSNFEKSTAGQQHCSIYAGPNGFVTNNPNRANWIAACTPIVNQAVANCTDMPCMKAAIFPALRPQVCALNQQFLAVKK